MRVGALGLVALAVPAASAPARQEAVHQQPPSRLPAEEVWSAEELECIAADLQRDVEDLRGERVEGELEVRLVDAETLAALVGARVDEALAAQPLAGRELAAKLFGMLPADFDLEAALRATLLEQSSSCYDPESRTIAVLETHPGAMVSLCAVAELARLLDEQLHDLAQRRLERADSTDARLALDAVVQGSVRAAMLEWRARRGGDLDRRALERAFLSRPLDALESAPPFVWKPIFATIPRGYSFLCRSSARGRMQRSNPRDVERALSELPLSTEQILHPVKYWKPTRADEPRELVLDLSRLAPDWELLHEDTLGELLVAVLTEPFEERTGLDGSMLPDLQGVPLTNEAAAGWGGDRHALLQRGDGLLLHAAFLWDTPADAREFEDALCAMERDLRGALARFPQAQPGSSGLMIEAGPAADEVRFSAWVGLTREAAEEGLAGLRFLEPSRG